MHFFCKLVHEIWMHWWIVSLGDHDGYNLVMAIERDFTWWHRILIVGNQFSNSHLEIVHWAEGFQPFLYLWIFWSNLIWVWYLEHRVTARIIIIIMIIIKIIIVPWAPCDRKNYTLLWSWRSGRTATETQSGCWWW